MKLRLALPLVLLMTALLFSCSDNTAPLFEKMKKFTETTNKAVADSVIDDTEAAELNKLIGELDKIDENDPNLEKALKKEENKKIFDDMTKAMISLMFCEGSDKIESL
ncbi:MAG TPA: hypothetical protein PLZ52_07070 [Bacteroidales bacterium]|nr:hypothetical protein [Bacteroidales bacterium]HOE04960.1 hypothetical protein [Bacteroidales bacterium]